MAGINQTDNEEDFMKNYGFTVKLINLLSKYNEGCPLMLASSIQVAYDNSYGKNKEAAENLILTYSGINRARFLFIDFPMFLVSGVNLIIIV